MTQTFRIGPWTIEPARHRICDEQGEPRLVSHKVMAVLRCLARRPGDVVSKETLIEEVWDGAFTSDESLTTVIYELRKALGDSARQPQFIETIRKGGYRLVAEVVPLEPTVSMPDRAPEATDESRTQTSSNHNALTPDAAAGVEDSDDVGLSTPAVVPSRFGRGQRMPIWAVSAMTIALLIAAVGWSVSRPSSDTAVIEADDAGLVAAEPPEVPRLESLAVLPLTHFGETCGEDAFTGGLTDMLVVDLAAEVPLEVLPSLATRSHDGPWDLNEVAEELDADLVIEGSVVRSAETLWLSVQLVDTASGRLLWGGSYERRLDDPLLVQRDLASSIAGEVQRIVMDAAATAAASDGGGDVRSVVSSPVVSP